MRESTTPQDPRDIPDYRALFVIDMKGYSAVQSWRMTDYWGDLEGMLATAFVQSGLGSEWHDPLYRDSTGDGLILALPLAKARLLVDPLAENLHRLLADHDRERLASVPSIRVRMSVHVGPLPDSHRGDPINDLCRFVASDAARDTVKVAEKHRAFVAMVLSYEAYQVIVRAGRTERLRAEDFRLTRASVDEKFAEPAWVHVPRVNGELLEAVDPWPGVGAKRVEEPVKSPCASDQPAGGVRNFGAIGSYLEQAHDFTINN
ncbi:hypothetical protein ACFU7Y_25775 [Kitasatospora sp. NPDC057542]|uniref:hypothetical protein n=1 Tax=Streptomycetaceae TaxID=2062 RepID=UPI001CCC8389|nr:hypothetical protein [Streptomyces sp. LS1784]